MAKVNAVQRRLRQCPAFVRILAFLGTVIVIAAPVVLPLYQFEYQTTSGRSVIWSPALLFVLFLAGLPVWTRWLYGLRSPWSTFGIRWAAQWVYDWGLAFVLGTAGVALLCWIQLSFGWGLWTPPSVDSLVKNALNGLVVALLVGTAEELIFRGWILFELEQDYSPWLALWLNAGLYAIAHYLRPISAILETWPQFFGLLLLGLTLVWLRRTQSPVYTGQTSTGHFSGRTTLALAAGLHSGFVWSYYQVDVGDLLATTNRVPDWLTGIDGNPLAGILGILLLSCYALAAYGVSHRLD